MVYFGHLLQVTLQPRVLLGHLFSKFMEFFNYTGGNLSGQIGLPWPG
jgi:hypothetical protein